MPVSSAHWRQNPAFGAVVTSSASAPSASKFVTGVAAGLTRTGIRPTTRTTLSPSSMTLSSSIRRPLGSPDTAADTAALFPWPTSIAAVLFTANVIGPRSHVPLAVSESIRQAGPRHTPSSPNHAEEKFFTASSTRPVSPHSSEASTALSAPVRCNPSTTTPGRHRMVAGSVKRRRSSPACVQANFVNRHAPSFIAPPAETTVVPAAASTPNDSSAAPRPDHATVTPSGFTPGNVTPVASARPVCTRSVGRPAAVAFSATASNPTPAGTHRSIVARRISPSAAASRISFVAKSQPPRPTRRSPAAPVIAPALTRTRGQAKSPFAVIDDASQPADETSLPLS